MTPDWSIMVLTPMGAKVPLAILDFPKNLLHHLEFVWDELDERKILSNASLEWAKTQIP
jgi:hypothetical protein